MAKLREQFLQDHPEAFRDIVGHRPASGGFKFGGIRMERLEIVQMRAVPLIGGCVELEMNLVETANEMDSQT